MNRELTIATAPRRTATTWENTYTTKQDLTAVIYDPIVVNIKTHTYHNTNKKTRDHFKDVGGYVGGHLRDGKRKKGYVLTRSFITLDADNTPTSVDLIAELNKRPFAWLAHTTLSHTPENPRWRIIIWLTRDVTADEYEAIARRISQDICPGLVWFDPTTFQPERMMYNAAVLKDNEDYRAEVSTGNPDLNPDEILARYTDWTDVTTWPGVNPTQAKAHEAAGKLTDPREKPGMLGAFNRAYTIEKAIEHFLPEVYKPGTTKDRYTYTKGTSSNGLIIYNGGHYAYSQHATDPANDGHSHSAFDLVRIHRFGDLDTDTKPGTPSNRMPSYIAMLDLANNDPETRKENARTTAQTIGEVFTTVENTDTTVENTATDWLTQLEPNKNGTYQQTITNFETIFNNDPHYNHIAWNAHANMLQVTDPTLLPWKQLTPGWTENDNAMLKTEIAKTYKGLYSPTKMGEALLAAATTRSFHPVRDYFTTLLPWDGIERLDTLLIDYLGADDTLYTRAVTRKTLVAAHRRTFHPGTKFDYVLVLIGPQGVGKSTIFARLAGDWFSDNLTLQDMKDKTAAEKLQGNLICELAELAGMRKTDAETVKAFVSRSEDKFRPAYGRNVVTFPRQGILVGSTNATDGFLRDVTGNRRWWAVNVTGEGGHKVTDLTPPIIDQIWAEARYRDQQGEKLYLEGDILDTATQLQKDNVEADERAGIVAEYLQKPLPTNWGMIPLGQRRIYLDGGTLNDTYVENGMWSQKTQRRQVSKIEIWAECFSRDPDKMTRKDSYEISAIMQQIGGWEDTGKRKRLPIYGRQRLYERTAFRTEINGTRALDKPQK